MSLPNTHVVVDCGPLPDPDNGRVNTSSGTVFLSTATYSCNVVTGASFRTCGADGLWSLSEPTCHCTCEKEL